MVMTPWFNDPVPFNMAAEYGTKKVITEHSTIGLVITTDGSISDIPRDEYAEAEARVIAELKEINKPFLVLVNSMYPDSPESLALADEISQKYNVCAKTVNCIELDEADINNILCDLLYEFPIKEIKVKLPLWITALESEHWLQKQLYGATLAASAEMSKVSHVTSFAETLKSSESVVDSKVERIDLSTGSATVCAEIDKKLFYDVLKEKTGVDIANEQQLMKEIIEFTKPQSYEDLLRLIGFAHGTGVWNENGEIFFDNRRMPLHEIPAYREDVYEMICEKLFKKGIYDTGFAYEVMEKARQGYYARKGEVDQSTVDALLSLGFELDFVFFLEKINYMFPRAHGAAYLKDAINLMWYKINFEKEFDKVM
jgi:hypothetical protein